MYATIMTIICMAQAAAISIIFYYYECIKPVQDEQKETAGKETKGQIDYPESISDTSWLN